MICIRLGMKLFSGSLRYLGITLIVLFCASGTLLSFLQRDLARSEWGQYVVGLSSFENRFMDFRVRNRLGEAKDPHIVLVNIDDESLSKIGTWPLPRTVHAQMVRQLKNFGSRVVALDILFPEKAPVCGEDNPDKDLARAFTEFNGDGRAATKTKSARCPCRKICSSS